jgi:cardiolipin synthase
MSHGEILTRHLDQPLLGGNRVSLSEDGALTDAAMLEAIDVASDHVNIELHSGPGGAITPALAQRLLQSCAAGIRVHVLCTSAQTSSSQRAVLEQLRAGGARVCVNEHWWQRWTSLGRRFSDPAPASTPPQLMVIDGRVAFVNGIQTGRPQTLRLEGPAVQRLQRIFIRHWQGGARCSLPEARYYPPLAVVHNQRVAMAARESGLRGYPLFSALLAAIDNAHKRVLLAEPSAQPGAALRQALVRAARRGVAVDLLLAPARSASSAAGALAAWRGGAAQRAQLLREGVCVQARVSQQRPAQGSGPLPCHPKVCIIDGEWVMLASSRGGWHSPLSGAQTHWVVLDAPFAESAEQLFLAALGTSGQAE